MVFTTESLVTEIRNNFPHQFIGLKVYGVPRGGWCIARLLHSMGLAEQVDGPELAQLIVDDLIDSGSTAHRWIATHNKPFWAPLDKRKYPTLGWVVFPWETNKQVDAEDQVRRIFQLIGEDAGRTGLKETPARVVKSWKELYKGYDPAQRPVVTVFPNGDDGIKYDQIITDEGSFHSHCEHHMIPFFGKYWFGYIPDEEGSILGLSKVARVVDYFSSKLQVQERLGQEIIQYIDQAVGPTRGMILVLRAQHLCKSMRGVRKDGWMTTSVIRGLFKDASTKNEFMSMIKLED